MGKRADFMAKIAETEDMEIDATPTGNSSVDKTVDEIAARVESKKKEPNAPKVTPKSPEKSPKKDKDQFVDKEILDVLEGTRGRKGMSLNRVHLSCTEEIYDYITLESRHRGVGKNAFVNQIIKDYMNSPEGKIF